MMIDLHTHILPSLDDGAMDDEMTLDMLRTAQNDDISQIVSTPHYICGANNYDTATLFNTYDRINKLKEESNINVEILLGNELFLDEYTLSHLKQNKCLTLNNSKYVLVEFSLIAIPQNAECLLYGLLNAGYIPILAHAERYREVIQDTYFLIKFIEMGCLIQVNSTSITGLAGRRITKTAMELILRNMVCVVASDCHSNRGRAPRLKHAYNIVSSRVGKKKADLLFTINPSKIIKNEKVTLGLESHFVHPYSNL
jgi:protein-tyrosine phosphatase